MANLIAPPDHIPGAAHEPVDAPAPPVAQHRPPTERVVTSVANPAPPVPAGPGAGRGATPGDSGSGQGAAWSPSYPLMTAFAIETNGSQFAYNPEKGYFEFVGTRIGQGPSRPPDR